jgi:putative ABC transport system substrate-binding protein
MNTAADDPEGQPRLGAFLQGLRQLGWTNDRNVRIDTRWGAGDIDRSRGYASELVALAPDVILASNAPIVGLLQQATRTVPIVFAAVSDPVRAGLVASLARPGGDTTGFSLFEYGISAKWLELRKEIAPGASPSGGHDVWPTKGKLAARQARTQQKARWARAKRCD